MFDRRTVLVLTFAVLLGCEEQLMTPADCPAICPAEHVTLVDTLLTAPLAADTSVRGYMLIREASYLLTANEDSLRAVTLIRFSQLDTTWYAATATSVETLFVGTSDSLVLSMDIGQRDTAVKNLRLVVWRLPAFFDTAATYASISPYLTDSTLIDTVAIPDRATDGVALSFKIANDLAIPPGDSGVVSLAFGIVANRQTAFTIQSGHGTSAPILEWLVHARAPHQAQTNTIAVEPHVSLFVQSPEPGQPPSGDLAVGGMPTARSTLYFSLPPLLTDSAWVVRADLILNTLRPVGGLAGDSFSIIAQPVVRDLGTKSVLYPDSSISGHVELHQGQTGPVELEIAPILRFWGTTVGDSTPRLIQLRGYPEGAVLGDADFLGMRAGALGPQLHVTYVRPYHYGAP